MGAGASGAEAGGAGANLALWLGIAVSIVTLGGSLVAWLAWRRKRSNDVLRLLEEATDCLGGDDGTFFVIVGGASDSKRREQARRLIDRALGLEPSNAEALYLQAVLLVESGEWDAAEALFSRVAQREPRTPAPHVSLAACLMSRPDRSKEMGERAIAELHHALDLDSEAVDALTQLGAALGEAGRLDEAIDCLQRVLKRKPNNISARLNLGVTYWRKGEHCKAVVELESVLAREPDHAKAAANLGVSLRELPGRSADALAAFERAIELEPSHADSFEGLAGCRTDLGDHLGAIEAAERATRLEPEAPKHWHNLAAAHLSCALSLSDASPAKGEHSRAAVGFFKKAMEVEPGFPPSAQMLKRLGEE